MAVPKKRMSKSKKNIRKNVWKKKAQKNANQALSIAKYVLYGVSKQAKKSNASYGFSKPKPESLEKKS
uniref:Large ribosomal subunit protein bL32c n=1 Tax=Scotinosphaera sp. NIES-154 TaxID=2249731 RepID=A0A2Z4MAK6_9CHLO|nr:ribosomal protein L32 [Scotinosphaera sp. NIES-154]